MKALRNIHIKKMKKKQTLFTLCANVSFAKHTQCLRCVGSKIFQDSVPNLVNHINKQFYLLISCIL